MSDRQRLSVDRLAREICQRETDHGGKTLDFKAVKTILRHLSDLIAEEWRLRLTFHVSTALREAAQRRYRRKKKKY